MEIKIQCVCGTRFAFDVEPENGRMPCAVSCPGCQADATEQANALLQQQAPTAPVRPAVRIAAPREPVAAAPEVVADAPPAAAPTGVVGLPASRRPVATARPPSGGTGRWKTILAAVVIGFVVLSAGWKWFRRIRTVVRVVAPTTLAAGEHRDWNFSFEDAVVVYVKHSDYWTVGGRSLNYFQQTLRKRATLTRMADDSDLETQAGDWVVQPAHHGFVSLWGRLDVPKPDYLGLAQHLSRELNTTVMVARDVDFTGEFHFCVYETGASRVEAEMKLVGPNLLEAEEKTSFTGKDWAVQHGYKRDPDSESEFHWGNADDISKKLGLRMWDFESRTNTAFGLLRVL